MEIVFLGSYCSPNGLCTEQTGIPNDVASDVDVFNSADILFLVDGTKSMRDYYSLISKSIENVAEDYVGVLSYQFGLAMYGDFISKKNMRIGDEIQLNTLVNLGPLINGSEFDDISSEKLFIDDPVGGFPEAIYAALHHVIDKTEWRETAPRFIIHIGDHGDRGNPPAQLIEKFKENNIFYLPVAVMGDYREKQNNNFVSQMQSILNANKTSSGITIGLPQVLTTYNKVNDATNLEDEYDVISRALSGALRVGQEIKDRIISEILDKETNASGEFGTSAFPLGHARMTDAAMELFGIDIKSIKNAVSETQISTRGFIETARIGDIENHWDYYVAVKPTEVKGLSNSFEKLCSTFLDADAENIFKENLVYIIETLTGDSLGTDERFYEYFKNREKIPLSSQVVLGEGIMQIPTILDDVQSDRAMLYQKEVCRTAALFQMILNRQIVKVPYASDKNISDETAQGDLQWDEASKIYSVLNTIPHAWESIDDFEERTVYVPLKYFPRPPTEILENK